MNVIRTWGTGVAAACIIGGVVSFLKPKKGVGKVLSIMLGAFFIAVIISPFCGRNRIKISNDLSDISYNTLNYDSFSDYMKSSQLTAAADEVKKQIADLLKKNKIGYKDIEVSMNIDKTDSIVIREVSVEVEDKAEIGKAYSIIKNKLSLEASVK